jgi:hypothetical protein
MQTIQHSNKKPLALYVGEGLQKKGGSIKGTTLLKGYRHWGQPLVKPLGLNCLAMHQA